MGMTFEDFLLKYKLMEKRTLILYGNELFGDEFVFYSVKNMKGVKKSYLCKLNELYFNALKKQYNNNKIENDNTLMVKSKYSYKLENPKNYKYEDIFNITIDINGDIIEENYFFNEEEEVQYDFINIFTISTYYKQSFEEYDEDDPNPQSFITAIKEELCCICYVNEPNVFYSDCKHFTTCFNCEEMKNLRRCPFCRTDVTKPKIKI